MKKNFSETPTLNELVELSTKEIPSPVLSIVKVESTEGTSKQEDQTIHKVGIMQGRTLWRSLRAVGVKEKSIPAILKNKVVRTSKNGELGQIQVKRHSGLVQNGAVKVLTKFEKEKTQGRGDIVEKFQAAHSKGLLSKDQERLLDLLVKRPNVRLSTLVAAAKADPVCVLDAFVKGCKILSEMDTLIELHQGLPAIARKLVKTAIDGTDICPMCAGAGKTSRRPYDGIALQEVCVQCEGHGKLMITDKHKEFAIQKALEVTKMIEREPLVNVTQQNLQVAGGGSFMEQMAKMSDAIIYGGGKVIDAEVSEASPNREDTNKATAP